MTQSLKQLKIDRTLQMIFIEMCYVKNFAISFLDIKGLLIKETLLTYYT